MCDNRTEPVELIAGYVLRDATREDLPVIVNIYNQSIPSRKSTADTHSISVASREQWFEHHHEQRPLWVVEHYGAVIGYLSFRNFYGRPAYHITAELAVYLDANHHGQGLGRAMVEHAIQAAPALHLENLLAFVFEHNATSVRLFEHAGFKRWGTLPAVAELDGQKVDLVILGYQVISEPT